MRFFRKFRGETNSGVCGGRGINTSAAVPVRSSSFFHLSLLQLEPGRSSGSRGKLFRRRLYNSCRRSFRETILLRDQRSADRPRRNPRLAGNLDEFLRLVSPRSDEDSSRRSVTNVPRSSPSPSLVSLRFGSWAKRRRGRRGYRREDGGDGGGRRRKRWPSIKSSRWRGPSTRRILWPG